MDYDKHKWKILKNICIRLQVQIDLDLVTNQQQAFIKSLTMYKYTTILSDSFRGKSTLAIPKVGKSAQQIVNQIQKGYQQSFNRQRSFSAHHHQESEFRNQIYNYQQYNDERFNQSFQGLDQQMKSRSCSAPKKPAALKEKNGISNRVQRLSDLGERHQQALRIVQLERKLKDITNKYAVNDFNSNQARFELYRNQLNQRKRENSMVVERSNRIDRNSENKRRNQHNLKLVAQSFYQQTQQMKDKQLYQAQKHLKDKAPAQRLSYDPKCLAKINPNLPKPSKAEKIDWQKYNKKLHKYNLLKQNAVQCNPLELQLVQNNTEKGKQAFKKLSSLQQKIKSSIKPYINI